MTFIRYFILFCVTFTISTIFQSCESSDSDNSEETTETVEVDILNAYKMLVTTNNGTTGQPVGASFFVLEKNTELTIQELGYTQTALIISGTSTTYTYIGGDLSEGTEGTLTLNTEANTWTLQEEGGRDMSGTFEIADFELR